MAIPTTTMANTPSTRKATTASAKHMRWIIQVISCVGLLMTSTLCHASREQRNFIHGHNARHLQNHHHRHQQQRQNRQHNDEQQQRQMHKAFGVRKTEVVESIQVEGASHTHEDPADDFYPRIRHIDTSGKGEGKGKGKGASPSSSPSSHDSGKGKGKGSSSYDSDKGSKSTKSTKSSKMPKSTKTSSDVGAPGNGKGKGVKSSTSADVTHAPTHRVTSAPTAQTAPTDTPNSDSSNDMPSTRPPVDIPVETPAPTAAPTAMPVTMPTASPTSVNLTPFGLEYVPTNDRIPLRSEYLEVIELTQTYLDNYFSDQFDDSNAAQLLSFSTLFRASGAFDFGDPILIEYDAVATFDGSSMAVPTQQILDDTLTAAFTGQSLNGYIGLLQNLPGSNVFSTVTMVTKQESILDPASAASRNSAQRATATAGGIAGAGVVLILAGGLLLSRRRRKVIKNKIKTSGDSKTLGDGQTIAETQTAGWSVADDSSYSQHSDRSSVSQCSKTAQPEDAPQNLADREITVIFEEADMQQGSGNNRTPSQRGDDDSSYHFEDGELMSIFKEEEISSFAEEWNERFEPLSSY